MFNGAPCRISSSLEKEVVEEADALALVCGHRRRRISDEVISRMLCACRGRMFRMRGLLSDRRSAAWLLALEEPIEYVVMV
jgi:hypothetical protein